MDLNTVPAVSRRQLLVAGCGVVAGSAGCVAPSRMSSETTSTAVDVGTASALTVETTNGDLSLSAGDGESVAVDATKRVQGDADHLRDVRVETDRSDGRLAIRVDHSAVPDGVSVEVDLAVAVPPSLSVANASSENGTVTATGVGGDGTYRSRNGDVDVTGVDGVLRLASENGDVSASAVVGVAAARTTNGAIDLSIRGLRTDAEIESTNGDVRLAIPDGADATLDLATANGEVGIRDLSLSERSDGDGTISGVLGDGTHRVRIRTTNGDVTVVARN